MSLVEPAHVASQTAPSGLVRTCARDAAKPNSPWPDSGPRTASEQLQFAVGHLKLTRPELSANGPVWLWQKVFACFSVLALLSMFAFASEFAEFAVLGVLSLAFLNLAVLRVFCIWNGRTEHTEISPVLSDEDLPAYTALVPLFGEAVIAGDLVSALSAIDYPVHKLQIVLVLEQSDPATQAALAAVALPAHFETVVVPTGQPQTKPRALNYALQSISGEFVVVFDAEDVPEPGQLRKAASVFRSSAPNLTCLQARLNVYNPNASWLTRGLA